MKNIEEINQSIVKKIVSERKHPDFFPGDIVKVGVRITEGKRDRIQYFEGVCIAKKNRDINSSFTCLLYTSPSPRDGLLSRMPSSA